MKRVPGRSTKSFVPLLLAALIVCSLAAIPAGAQDVKLTYALWAQSEEVNQVEERLRAFEEAHPGVEVEVFAVAGSGAFRDRILSMIAAGTAPDLFMMSRAYQFDFHGKGVFEPLDRYIQNDPNIDFDEYLGRSQIDVDGQIWGIPEHGGGLTIGYNEARFAEAGLADPWTLYKQDEWTYDTYLESARRLSRDTNGDGVNDLFGSSAWTGQQELTALVSAFGGQMFSDDGREVRFNSPESIDGLRWAMELETVYDVAGGAFGEGSLAMAWICPRCVFRDVALNSYDFDWNIVPAPRGPDGYRAPGGFNSLFVYSGSPHKQLAYELAAFLTSRDLQMELVEQKAVFTPVRRSVLLSREFRDQYADLNIEAWLQSATEYLTPVPTTHVPDAWNHAIAVRGAVLAAIAGEKGLNNAVIETADVVQAALNRDWSELDNQ